MHALRSSDPGQALAEPAMGLCFISRLIAIHFTSAFLTSTSSAVLVLTFLRWRDFASNHMM
jgi:hypothetical protein